MKSEITKRIEKFVYDRESHFVDPEKVAAVDLYGIEKAEKIWENGKPDWNTRTKLQKISLLYYLNGIK